MGSTSTRNRTTSKVLVFGVIPCVLGIGIGQYLRWSGVVWLTDAGGFWPIVCLGATLAALTRLAVSSVRDRTLEVWAWLMIIWTWLYFPYWLTAAEIPQSSAVVSTNGRVSFASEAARQPGNKVFLLSGLGGNKIVRNVEGTVAINAIEVKYRFAEPYIARRNHHEDIAKSLIDAATSALAVESKKPRSARIALFETPKAHDRLIDDICRAVARDGGACPARLTLKPQLAATNVGGHWGKHYTEQEAITEKHLPTLVQLLTQDSPRLSARDAVYALFMEIAETTSEMAKIARRSRMLDDRQFDELIERIIVTPNGGDDALGILIDVNRLNQDQRLALRAKVFREASIESIVQHAVPLRILDTDIQQLAPRMRSAFDQNPGVAVSALDAFGERLPLETQNDAVRAIANARAFHALAALRRLNFSNSLRELLLQKVIADASVDDLTVAKLSRENLEDLLTPAEARRFIATAIRKSASSKEWLDFAVKVLPTRAMTIPERKAIINELMFSSTKIALEFVSENRHYLEAAEVKEVTRDYARTIERDMCLHLTHRNATRGVEYFSEAQVEIFRECAQGH